MGPHAAVVLRLRDMTAGNCGRQLAAAAAASTCVGVWEWSCRRRTLKNEISAKPVYSISLDLYPVLLFELETCERSKGEGHNVMY